MWEDRYASKDHYAFGRAPAHVLADNPWVWDGAQTALCVADGEGRNGVYLASKGVEVSSFDVAPTAVGRAQSLATEAGVQLDAHVSDWSGWDWSSSFDLVVAIFVQYTGPDQRPSQFADLKAATKPGGRLLLHGFTPKQIDYGTGGPPVAENMYTTELLADAFGDWDILRLASYDREQTSGTSHVGNAALIDLIAQRPT